MAHYNDYISATDIARLSHKFCAQYTRYAYEDNRQAWLQHGPELRLSVVALSAAALSLVRLGVLEPLW